MFAGSGLVEDDEELSATVEQARRAGHARRRARAPGFEGSCVMVDNRAAARDLTDYLSRSAIARSASSPGRPGCARRASGSRASRTPWQAIPLEPGPLCEGDFGYASGHAAALDLLARDRLPDAVIGANDETAIGVLTGLRGAGVDVPGALSVAGIGDTRPASFLELTTVSVPTFELGASAARRIIAGREAHDESHVVMPHRLVPRATSARRAAAG